MNTETLTCGACERAWERPRVRGQKPKRCPACVAADIPLQPAADIKWVPEADATVPFRTVEIPPKHAGTWALLQSVLPPVRATDNVGEVRYRVRMMRVNGICTDMTLAETYPDETSAHARATQCAREEQHPFAVVREEIVQVVG
jgi:hypothetical protein